MPNHNISESTAPGSIVQAARNLGSRIALARSRRSLRQEDLARKAGISKVTLNRIESGALGTGLGAYIAVLWALGLDSELDAIADPDTDDVGRTLESARRGQRVRRSQVLHDDF